MKVRWRPLHIIVYVTLLLSTYSHVMNLMHYIFIMRDVNIIICIIIARSKSADGLNNHLNG